MMSVNVKELQSPVKIFPLNNLNIEYGLQSKPFGTMSVHEIKDNLKLSPKFIKHYKL